MRRRVVLVCGGRDFNDRAKMFETLDKLHAKRPITEIVHGGARGADRLAGAWASEHSIPVIVCHAQWGRFGSGAGPHRNQVMLDLAVPNLIVAFPGGPGTRDMVTRAARAKVPILAVR